MSRGRMVVRKSDFNTIITQLRSAGHRLTKARLAIIETLLGASGPLSAQEILTAKNVRAASKEKTTIYRELDFLIEEGLSRTVDLRDGKRRFEISLHDDHHHHLVCTGCDRVECVELPKHLDEIEAELSKKHKFLIKSHTLEFFGLCRDCR